MSYPQTARPFLRPCWLIINQSDESDLAHVEKDFLLPNIQRGGGGQENALTIEQKKLLIIVMLSLLQNIRDLGLITTEFIDEVQTKGINNIDYTK